MTEPESKNAESKTDANDEPSDIMSRIKALEQAQSIEEDRGYKQRQLRFNMWLTILTGCLVVTSVVANCISKTASDVAKQSADIAARGVLVAQDALKINKDSVEKTLAEMKVQNDSAQTSADAAKTALELSMQPSIDFQLYPGGAYIINTSNQVLKDLCIHIIVYVFSPETEEVIQRLQPSGNFKLTNRLKPKEKCDLKEDLLVSVREGIYSPDNPNAYRAAIITYRRAADMKKFKALYVFHSFIGNGEVVLIGLNSGQITNGWSGRPQKYLKVIQRIEEVEKVMFKTENFL